MNMVDYVKVYSIVIVDYWDLFLKYVLCARIKEIFYIAPLLLYEYLLLLYCTSVHIFMFCYLF